MQEYVELVLRTHKTHEKQYTICINTVPDNVLIVNPLWYYYNMMCEGMHACENAPLHLGNMISPTDGCDVRSIRRVDWSLEYS
jgi:hypothetical protein